MSGLGRVIVGYRKGDRQIRRLEDEHGQIAVAVAKCVAGCGYPVFFVASGQDAYRLRDPEVICEPCYERYKDDVHLEL